MQSLRDNANEKQLTFLTLSIIAFWALWSTLVALTDVINFLQAIAWLPMDWTFTSNNFALVVKSVGMYGLQNTLLPLALFFVIVIWACLIAVLFWRALFAHHSKNNYLQKCYTAFLACFSIEAVFILADELFIQYDFEHGHMDRLGFKLITFLVF
ncbi:MAG: hypothetical protein A3F42_06780, partial [Gammaproteobacteria bacterium RIFCSPHIGHO2_12_FULL_37_34]